MKKVIIGAIISAFLLSPTSALASGVTFGASGSTGSASGAQTSTTQEPSTNISSSCPIFGSDLRYGMTNGDVTLLQKFLRSKGYLSATPTGYFGTLTLTAVRSYQASKKLPTTGFVGEGTRAAIKNDSCGTGKVYFPATQTPNSDLSAEIATFASNSEIEYIIIKKKVTGAAGSNDYAYNAVGASGASNSSSYTKYLENRAARATTEVLAPSYGSPEPYTLPAPYAPGLGY